jgi:ADP-ribose pyrophosphatase
LLWNFAEAREKQGGLIAAMSKYREETVSNETRFEGKMIRLEQLVVRLPNGRTASREVVRHPGAVAVLVEPVPGRTVLVTQYRKATERELLEIPAGKLEPGEPPEECAVRELAEETGYRALRVQQVASFYTSPGFADEVIHLFYTHEVEDGVQHLDQDEFLDVHLYSRDEVARLIEDGKVQDAKTLVALLWWLNRPQG